MFRTSDYVLMSFPKEYNLLDRSLVKETLTKIIGESRIDNLSLCITNSIRQYIRL